MALHLLGTWDCLKRLKLQAKKLKGLRRRGRMSLQVWGEKDELGWGKLRLLVQQEQGKRETKVRMLTKKQRLKLNLDSLGTWHYLGMLKQQSLPGTKQVKTKRVVMRVQLSGTKPQEMKM